MYVTCPNNNFFCLMFYDFSIYQLFDFKVFTIFLNQIILIFWVIFLHRYSLFFESSLLTILVKSQSKGLSRTLSIAFSF